MLKVASTMVVGTQLSVPGKLIKTVLEMHQLQLVQLQQHLSKWLRQHLKVAIYLSKTPNPIRLSSRRSLKGNLITFDL